MVTMHEMKPFFSHPLASEFEGKSTRERLECIYEAKNPDMLGKVDDLASKYEGKEQELFCKLTAKANIIDV